MGIATPRRRRGSGSRQRRRHSPRDHGQAVPAYFTAKPTGEGAGLGLSISYELVTAQHRGAITVDSRLAEFAKFTVRLPRRSAAAPAIAAETDVES
ncbi:MAG: ATP-binding protein [Roseiarcus sp.]